MNTNNTPKAPTREHLVSGGHGIYIPRTFVRAVGRDNILHVSPEDLDILEAGPDHEHYWDAWDITLSNARVRDAAGNLYHLQTDDNDGDLYAVPVSWEWVDELEQFVPPQSDTLRRLELPTAWASALVNRDFTGLDDRERAALEAFLERENLRGWNCVDVSHHEWYAYTNDGTDQSGQVALYTFVR